jgi:hypothetical protein
MPDLIMRCGHRQITAAIFSDRLEIMHDGVKAVLAKVPPEAEPTAEPNTELSTEPKTKWENKTKYSDGAFTLWKTGNTWTYQDETTGETGECVLAAICG